MGGRSPRLNRNDYKGVVAVGYTAFVHERRHILANPEFMSAGTNALHKSCTQFDCRVPIYCFMPDHAHIFLIGDNPTSDALAAMEKFKLLTSQWLFRAGTGEWQEGFHDHIVRWSEGWRTQARYFILNPLRAGLVENPLDWPYMGSIGYQLPDVFNDAFFDGSE